MQSKLAASIIQEAIVSIFYIFTKNVIVNRFSGRAGDALLILFTPK